MKLNTVRDQYLNITHVQPASEQVLMHGVYLIILYATKIPPHLAVSVNGKMFTLSIKGPTVQGELSSLLRTIQLKRIETLFVKLNVPALFTLEQLNQEITACMLAYPKVDVGLATCLAPIKDFCSQVFAQDYSQVEFVFELLPRLYQYQAATDCYQLNLDRWLTNNDTFALKTYSLNQVNEEIERSLRSQTLLV